MTDTRLAAVLNYRLRELLGAGVDYNRLFTNTPILEYVTREMTTMNLPVTPPVPIVGPPTRTPEQEARFRDLDDAAHERMFTPEEGQEYEALRDLLACPTPLPPRIRVSVTSNGREWRIVVRINNENKDLPQVRVIKALLPPADKHFLPTRQGRYRSTMRILQESLATGLPARSLHDALRAWVLASITNQSVESSTPMNPDAETLALLRAQPATLEVAGRVYHLVPTHEINTQPLIRRVKQRALVSANAEAIVIKERATTDARLVVSQAEERARRVRDELEAERRRQVIQAPQWLVESHKPYMYSGERFYVIGQIETIVTEIRLTVTQWNKVLFWNPLRPTREGDITRMPVWILFNRAGIYSIEATHCFNEGMYTTHIAGTTCMHLQALPPAINSLRTFEAVEVALSRGMRVINLNSPLNRSVDNYWPSFKEQIPPTVMNILRRGLYHDRDQWRVQATAKEAFRWDREETIDTEAESTFTVNDPMLLRPPVPVTANDEVTMEVTANANTTPRT